MNNINQEPEAVPLKPVAGKNSQKALIAGGAILLIAVAALVLVLVVVNTKKATYTKVNPQAREPRRITRVTPTPKVAKKPNTQLTIDDEITDLQEEVDNALVLDVDLQSPVLDLKTDY